MGSPHEKVHAAQTMARRANEEVLRLTEENAALRSALRRYMNVVADHYCGDMETWVRRRSGAEAEAMQALASDDTNVRELAGESDRTNGGER